MSTSGDQNHRHPHILVYPYPAQGHMLPLLDLTNQLALRHLTITLIITPKNLPTLTPLLSSHPSIQTLVLPFPSHPKIPPGVENVKDLGTHGNLSVINALANLHDPIIQWFNSHPNPPVALISDFFLGYTLRLADHLKIPRITFFSSGAYLASIHEYCWRNLDLVQSSSNVIDFPYVPRKPSLKKEHVPSIVLAHKGADPESELLRVSMLANTDSWGCVFNSFQDLEGEYLDHLKRRMGHNRVYGVGPLSLIDAGDGGLDRGNLNTGSGGDVMAWLDGCPDGSVLYVGFGSQKLLDSKQMEALASGLELSGVRFVWTVKTGSAQETKDGYGIVPEGFEERVAGRGRMVKGWSPQVLILGHRAVGGFVSHCGWNSVLEAIAGGVLILGWPMEADQYVNAKLLVEDLGVAIQVCEGASGVPDPAQLGKVIAESLSGDSAEKVRAKELRDKAFSAVSDGGSSVRDLDELVKELSLL
ncbi:PREDICTED: UDP-glycosyltransferase 89A2-like [Fragaria vesca subsp. vesca]|uniref:UDP-glycosyltransferase 89A2-like n=1 Tax=Fragaria vesca subsp. vesca TaxID=101020 RepID=UPI0002C2EB13|nr:PREDICTED: UDP-glycosyltransferase 89A2-like [Fragaria vesca subsp. vesca]